MKVERLVSIIMILLDQKRIGAKELAERFEVSPRTIYRDIESISQAGIPVRGAAGVGGGFEIMPNFKIDKNTFSTADLSAILMGLTNLSQMIRGEELVNALAKVRSFIPTDRAKDIELKANQVLIDLSPWIGNRNIQSNLELIKTAIGESRLLSFEYTNRHGEKIARVAEPYQLVLKSSCWYWQGYCHIRKNFRLFKISRTSHLEKKEELFTPRNPPVPQLVFSEVLSTMQTKISIRIHKTLMDRVLDFCPFEEFSPDGDHHYLVRFPFIENDFYYSILIGFGDRCECLEPLPIRREMQRRIHKMAALYTIQN